MFRSILVAVDGSDANKQAVDTAVNIAKTQGATLTAICVFDIGSYSTFNYGLSSEVPYMEEMIKDALKYITEVCEREGVELKSVSKLGKPAEAIIEEAANHQLVICGSHGRTGLSRTLIGSVAEKVVRLAPCPVLVVRLQNDKKN